MEIKIKKWTVQKIKPCVEIKTFTNMIDKSNYYFTEVATYET